MPVTTPPSITALPAAPDPADRSTFNSRAYPWSAALATFTTQVEAVADNVFDNATDAAASAASASSAVAAASTATTQAGIATTKAGEALTSATNAATSASGAAASATNAANSATAAAASAASISGGPVTSVNGRTGVVTGVQDTLVSGTNIKTIGGVSVLGSGDLTVGGSIGPTKVVDANITLTAYPGSQVGLWHTALDANRTMLIITGTANIHAVIHDATTNTFGSAVLVRTATLTGERAAASVLVSTDKVLCVSLDSSTGLQAVVLSATGSSISVGTAATATLASTSEDIPIDLKAVGSSFVVGYSRGTKGLRAITVSGTTATIGSELALTGNLAGAGVDFAVIDSTKVLTVSTTSTNIYWLPVSVSGTTLTAGTAATIAVSSVYYPTVRPFASGGRFWSTYRNTSLYGVVISVSGTTATASTVAITGATSSERIQCYLTVGNQAIIVGGATGGGNIAVLTDSAGTAVAGTPISSSITGMYYAGSNYLVMAYDSQAIKVGISGNNPSITAIQDFGAPTNSYAVGLFSTSQRNLSKFSGLPANYLKGATKAAAISTLGTGATSPNNSICDADGVVVRETNMLPYVSYINSSRVSESEIWVSSPWGIDPSPLMPIVKLKML